MKVSRTIAAAAAGCLLLAAGCGDDDSTGSSSESTGAGSDLCGTLEGFDSTVDTITGTDGDSNADTTVGDVEDAIDQLEADLDDVETEGTDLPAGLDTALQSGADAIENAIDNLPSDETIAEAGDAVSSAQESVATAWSTLLDRLNCSSS
jgi:ABC-type glycerol-3-phosphate transport system substrate-binding protein